jgi:hypothetical protein
MGDSCKRAFTSSLPLPSFLLSSVFYETVQNRLYLRWKYQIAAREGMADAKILYPILISSTGV